MILNCGHIFHIGCLVEIHFDEFTHCGGIIDERFIKNCICTVCDEQMEVEDILHMHNKFTKSTKEKLNNEIKNIHLYQRKLYTNFINHIEFLNNAKNTTVNDTVKIVDKSRMTKLVNK